jgi:hypothetical protein
MSGAHAVDRMSIAYDMAEEVDKRGLSGPCGVVLVDGERMTHIPHLSESGFPVEFVEQLQRMIDAEKDRYYFVVCKDTHALHVCKLMRRQGNNADPDASR